MKFFQPWVVRGLCLLMLLLWMGAGSVCALTVRLEPASVILPAAQSSFDVDVVIEGVTDLGGFEFRIDYDPGVVSVTGEDQVTLGPFLGSTGKSTLPFPVVEDDEGYVLFSAVGYPKDPAGPNGSGTLATVSFTVISQEGGLLDLNDVQVLVSKGTPLVVDTIGDALLVDPSGNLPPVAAAGPDRTVVSGSQVTLDGSGSTDSDGAIVAYLWEQIAGPSVQLNNASTVSASFTAPQVEAEGSSMDFRITVTDDGGLSDSDEMQVEVVQDSENQPPTANAGTDFTAAQNSTVQLDGSGSSDPDGDSLTFFWEQTGGVLVILSDATASTPTFTAPLAGLSGTVLYFRLTVTDPDGLSSTDSVGVTIVQSITGEPPVADAGPDLTVFPESVVQLDASASSDPDNDIVSYGWLQTAGTAVILSDPDEIRSSFTAPADTATLVFRVTVTDSSGNKATDDVTINVVPAGQATKVDGLFKDAAVTINAYIQTYTAGSVLVILTPDLAKWYVFIDSDWADGVSQFQDLTGMGRTLSLHFLSDDSAAATLDYGDGTSSTWSLQRVFAASANSPWGDGIYKEAAGTAPNNLYMQNYEVGSAILIFTPDLVKWTVFLVPDAATSLDVPSDLAGKGYSLTVSPSSGNQYVMQLTPTSGATENYVLSPVFPAPDW